MSSMEFAVTNVLSRRMVMFAFLHSPVCPLVHRPLQYVNAVASRGSQQQYRSAEALGRNAAAFLVGFVVQLV